MTTRAVKAGEVLFEERPLVVGPCPVTAPQCLQCGRKVDGGYLCPECGMPMCAEECSESAGHRHRECGLLREGDSIMLSPPGGLSPCHQVVG